jgi:dTDP-4-dehydrorhamnose reductase
MRIFVTGANGLLGSSLVAHAAATDHKTVATFHNDDPGIGDSRVQLDITDRNRTASLIDEYSPDVIVNCAAMTDVDNCESSPDRARAVNAVSPGDIASLAAERDMSFVHISTDYVFDGNAQSPYTVDHDPAPLQVYGQTKLDGERAVFDAHPNPLVPRLSFVYGRHGATGDLTGFPAWVAERLNAGESVPLFVDQHITPSRAGQVAGTIIDCLEANVDGRVHIAAQSCVTPFTFGEQLADQLGYDATLLERGTTEAVERAADRPAYTCLDVSDIEAALHRPQPTLTEDLAAILC